MNICNKKLYIGCNIKWLFFDLLIQKYVIKVYIFLLNLMGYLFYG